MGWDAPPLMHVNAVLNTAALILLCIGVALIKRKRVTAHRNVMIAAFVMSSLFLVSYLTNRAMHGDKRYDGEGLDRTVYLIVLATHVPLAATVPVFAIVLIRHGLKRRIEKHRRLAKIAFPIWVYVSLTGVFIYAMLVWAPLWFETGG